MARRQRNIFAKSNKGKTGEILINNLLASSAKQSKARAAERDRKAKAERLERERRIREEKQLQEKRDKILAKIEILLKKNNILFDGLIVDGVIDFCINKGYSITESISSVVKPSLEDIRLKVTERFIKSNFPGDGLSENLKNKLKNYILNFRNNKSTIPNLEDNVRASDPYLACKKELFIDAFLKEQFPGDALSLNSSKDLRKFIDELKNNVKNVQDLEDKVTSSEVFITCKKEYDNTLSLWNENKISRDKCLEEIKLKIFKEDLSLIVKEFSDKNHLSGKDILESSLFSNGVSKKDSYVKDIENRLAFYTDSRI